MAKLMEVSAEAVRPEFMEVSNKLDGAEKAINAKTTSRYLQDANGPVEVNVGQPGVKKLGTKTYHAHEAVRGGLPGDVMQTATTKSGTPINDQSQLTEDSLVTVNGMQCTLEVATRMGLVVRNADGSYSDSTGGGPMGGSTPPAATAPLSNQQPDQQSEQHKQQQQEQQSADFFGEDEISRGFMNIAKMVLGPDEADTVMSRALTSYLAGGNPKPAVNELASALQIEPDEAVSYLDHMSQKALDNAAEFISQRYGGQVDGVDVLEWAGENLRPTTKAHVMAAIYNGAISELDNLVKKYAINERY